MTWNVETLLETLFKKEATNQIYLKNEAANQIIARGDQTVVEKLDQ